MSQPLCPTCSIGESQKSSELLAEDMCRVVHRHVIFTIDETNHLIKEDDT